MRVTCHPRGDSLGPGSATLGGSARTLRDSTRAFNGASNGDPADDSSPAATAPLTTKERDQEEGLSFHSLTASSTQRRTQTRPDQTSDDLRLDLRLLQTAQTDCSLGVPAHLFIAPALRPSLRGA